MSDIADFNNDNAGTDGLGNKPMRLLSRLSKPGVALPSMRDRYQRTRSFGQLSVSSKQPTAKERQEQTSSFVSSIKEKSNQKMGNLKLAGEKKSASWSGMDMVLPNGEESAPDNTDYDALRGILSGMPQTQPQQPRQPISSPTPKPAKPLPELSKTPPFPKRQAKPASSSSKTSSPTALKEKKPSDSTRLFSKVEEVHPDKSGDVQREMIKNKTQPIEQTQSVESKPDQKVKPEKTALSKPQQTSPRTVQRQLSKPEKKVDQAAAEPVQEKFQESGHALPERSKTALPVKRIPREQPETKKQFAEDEKPDMGKEVEARRSILQPHQDEKLIKQAAPAKASQIQREPAVEKSASQLPADDKSGQDPSNIQKPLVQRETVGKKEPSEKQLSARSQLEKPEIEEPSFAKNEQVEDAAFEDETKIAGEKTPSGSPADPGQQVQREVSQTRIPDSAPDRSSDAGIEMPLRDIPETKTGDKQIQRQADDVSKPVVQVKSEKKESVKDTQHEPEQSERIVKTGFEKPTRQVVQRETVEGSRETIQASQPKGKKSEEGYQLFETQIENSDLQDSIDLPLKKARKRAEESKRSEEKPVSDKTDLQQTVQRTASDVETLSSVATMPEKPDIEEALSNIEAAAPLGKPEAPETPSSDKLDIEKPKPEAQKLNKESNSVQKPGQTEPMPVRKPTSRPRTQVRKSKQVAERQPEGPVVQRQAQPELNVTEKAAEVQREPLLDARQPESIPPSEKPLPMTLSNHKRMVEKKGKKHIKPVGLPAKQILQREVDAKPLGKKMVESSAALRASESLDLPVEKLMGDPQSFMNDPAVMKKISSQNELPVVQNKAVQSANVVQREIADDQPAIQPDAEESAAAEMGFEWEMDQDDAEEQSSVDLPMLARQIFPMVKRLIAVEKERSTGRNF